MPYNNRKIDAIDDTLYERKISYSPDNIESLYWIINKEILLHFKPIKEKVGMYIYEPVEPLTNGLYAVDSGRLGAVEHQGLRLSSIQEGILTHELKEGVLVFIVGDKTKLEKNMEKTQKTGAQEENEKIGSKSENQSSHEKSSDNLRKSIDNVFKGIFGK